VHLSASQWIIYGALSLLWAALGYRLSENDRRALGRTPWGLPSALWAFFWFLSLILGLILYLIAHSVGVRQAQQHPPMPGPPNTSVPPPTGMSSRGSASASELFPAYPRPANSQPSPDVIEPEMQQPPTAPQAPLAPDPSGPEGAAAAPPQSPPAWHPDPSGRFRFRWWDGHEWTSQVSTDGHHLIDTNPDQRIGSY